MSASRPLVYLDTETTGLDPDRHEVWEIAYAVDSGPIHSAVVSHSTKTANPESLRLGHYHPRGAEGPSRYAGTIEADLRIALADATLVAANPHFDASFLLARWGLHNSEAPWHYRMLDISAYAAGVLGLHHVPGLAEVIARLNDTGLHIPEPDHTAARDVLALRQAHWALLAHREREAQ